MEGGELGVENMESLTELGEELTLGDIDGGRRGKGRGTGAGGGGSGPHGLPHWRAGGALVSPGGSGAASAAGGVGCVGGVVLEPLYVGSHTPPPEWGAGAQGGRSVSAALRGGCATHAVPASGARGR